MSDKKSFYITTTLPYVNADPHMGHALEFVRADIIARWKKIQGFEVFFNTGTDEHGLKVSRAAEKEGKSVLEYINYYSNRFRELLPKLGIEDVHFIRTSDSNHEKAAQEFWKRVNDNGYIYKKDYQANYCVGCESEKTSSELVEGKCPIHTNLDIEKIEEENYFFKYSEFGNRLLKFYEENPNFVVPDFRLNEIREFIGRGLEDFSISRLKEKMPWGIPVPGDSNHVMYVWFDALVNYISTLGWPDDKKNFEKFWENGNPTQYCGKDNIRFQAAMWQAMLMAAELPNSAQIVINGFVTGDGGVKMSKSLGNVADPVEIAEKYGSDALRYFFARELSTFEDSPFTMERFIETYNAGLANGLGNLVARTIKMAVSYDAFPNINPEKDWLIKESYCSKYLSIFEIKKAIDEIWERIGAVDKFIQEEKPFQEIKTNPDKAKRNVQHYVNEVYRIAWELQPFLPVTAEKILTALQNKTMPENLFPRLDA